MTKSTLDNLHGDIGHDGPDAAADQQGAADRRTLHESMPECDMPREKFKRHGAAALTDTDLIAIMLRTGVHGVNVMELARTLYSQFGNSITRMGDASLQELMATKGLGEAKAIAFAAALELGKRRQLESLEYTRIMSSEDCYKFFLPRLVHLPSEEFHVAVVDAQMHVLAEKMISKGGINGTVVDIRTLMREVLRLSGSGFFVAHNHPSGAGKPSRQYVDLTKRIAAAARTLDVRFIDHVIVARGSAGRKYYSFSDEGMID